MRTQKNPENSLAADGLVSGPRNGAAPHMQDDFIPRLTEIWQNLLGIQPIGPDQSYFDLGGDSIFAVQLFAQIEQEFKIRLPLASFFDAPTIRELAEVLSRAGIV
jgi:acyl carrier protein